MKWESVKNPPKERGWYLLKCLNRLPNNIGRCWFDGKEFMYDNVPLRYFKDGAEILWLDEPPAPTDEGQPAQGGKP